MRGSAADNATALWWHEIAFVLSIFAMVNGPYDNDDGEEAPLKGQEKLVGMVYLLAVVGGAAYLAYSVMGSRWPWYYWAAIFGLAIVFYGIKQLIRGGLNRF